MWMMWSARVGLTSGLSCLEVGVGVTLLLAEERTGIEENKMPVLGGMVEMRVPVASGKITCKYNSTK